MELVHSNFISCVNRKITCLYGTYRVIHVVGSPRDHFTNNRFPGERTSFFICVNAPGNVKSSGNDNFC